MYKFCKTEQSANRQRQLEQGLLQLMLTRRYEDISVSDLCQFMNIPRKSFYRYFSSKDGALYALMDHTMMEFYDGTYQKRGSVNHLGDLEQFFVFWHDHRKLLEALVRSNMSGLLVERATSLALRERLIPGVMLNVDPQILQIVLSFPVSGLFSMVIQWHKQNYSPAPEEMNKIATELLTKPLIIF